MDRQASNCRWATPTLFMAAPLWFDSERHPWTCVLDAAPRPLATTESCAACARWEPSAPSSGAVPFMMDWMSASPLPHETE